MRYKRIGVVFLPTDCTGPTEFYTLMNNFDNIIAQSVNCRFPEGTEQLNKDTYEFSLKYLSETVDCLRPTMSFDCIGLACTSFAFAVGSERISAEIRNVHPETTIIDMKTSLFKALKFLSLTKLLVLTAYKSDLNNILKLQLETKNFEVIAIEGFNMDTDYDIYQISQDKILSSVYRLKKIYLEPIKDMRGIGLVISCSAFNILKNGFIDILEKNINIPVVTSMQSFCWDILQLCSIDNKINGYGMLLSGKLQ